MARNKKNCIHDRVNKTNLIRGYLIRNRERRWLHKTTKSTHTQKQDEEGNRSDRNTEGRLGIRELGIQHKRIIIIIISISQFSSGQEDITRTQRNFGLKIHDLSSSRNFDKKLICKLTHFILEEARDVSQKIDGNIEGRKKN